MSSGWRDPPRFGVHRLDRNDVIVERRLGHTKPWLTLRAMGGREPARAIAEAISSVHRPPPAASRAAEMPQDRREGWRPFRGPRRRLREARATTLRESMIMVRRLGRVAVVVLTLTLAACTSSPPGPRAKPTDGGTTWRRLPG